MWAEATDKRVELMADGNRNGGCKGNCHTAPTPCSPQSCVAYHNVLKKSLVRSPSLRLLKVASSSPV